MIKRICFLIAVLAAPVSAQDFQDSTSILQKLMPQNTGPMVRSMTPVAKRGINIQGPLPANVDLPKVDLTVNFELGSARLTTDGMIALRSLAKALLHPSIANMTFQVAGHTDGRGDAFMNQGLSERRAQAVVEFLTVHYEVPNNQLIPIGYGFNRPMDPTNLMNPLNRRVEIINLQPLS
ncbi:OmpA family protein [Roseobacter sp.]|uniref:OmpA family protein n=1 Tax=Roseobacter sp. TaxID=1907202 RepID=UPI00385C74C9